MSNNMVKSKRFLISLLIFVITLISISLFAVLYDCNRAFVFTKTEGDILSKLKEAEDKGTALLLTSYDINNLSSLVQSNYPARKGIIIKGIYVELKADKMTLFVPAKVKGISVLLSSRGEIIYKDNSIEIIPENFKIGLIPLPKGIVMKNLMKYVSGKYKIRADAIILSRNLIPINIKSVAIKNDELVIEIIKQPEVQSVLKLIDEGKKAPAEANNPKDVPATNKEKTSGTKVARRDRILSSAVSQLQSAEGAVKTFKEKSIINSAKAVIKKMIGNPHFAYMGEADRLKAMYDALTPDEQTVVKSAVLSHVNTEALLELNTE
jgi:hypothetical protein